MSKTINFCLLVLLLFCSFGCDRSSGLKDFTYRYSMESIGNFKVELQLNPDSTYQIGRYNYFFDKFKGKVRPYIKEGILTPDEFDRFAKLIKGSKLEKMDDAYGFDRKGDIDNSIVYMIELRQDEQSKFVSVNANTDEHLPDGFNRLITFTGEFISDKMETAE
ncbi:hypothetical protein SAMN05216365_10548 [Porphyromonadaceae bacterium NLAE-zl-C104]|nr:hypothetical protein SAMN05216365_10548 [Porphyromonadaceae bacterium NLAE-zl-C104]